MNSTDWLWRAIMPDHHQQGDAPGPISVTAPSVRLLFGQLMDQLIEVDTVKVFTLRAKVTANGGAALFV